jgi:membrane protein required for colicin V production
MLIDVIFLVVVVMAIIKGFRKGFIVGLFSFFAFLIGLAAALKLSAIAAMWLEENTEVSKRWLPVLAFIVVFSITVLLVRLGAKMLEGATRLVMLGWLNRLGGILFFLFIYIFIFSILFFYAQQLGLFSKKGVENSITYPWLSSFAPRVMDALAVIFPFLKDMFADLMKFFGDPAR